jgi:DnaJ-class molecular chaperone
MKRSFYEMLEVSRKATREEIDAAYAHMTQKLEATTSVRGTADALSQLNMIREGYNILADPEKRTLYDAKLYATEAGITLMFFPKDTRAVKKLGIDTLIFAALACVFTYVIYQKMTREANPARADQIKIEKAAAEAPKADIAQASVPGATVSTIEPSATNADANAITRTGSR